MISSKDICVLIPTFNRPKDIEKTIEGVFSVKNMPGKIIILDQSSNRETEILIKKYLNKDNLIKYTHHKIPGKNIALNKEIDNLKKNFNFKIFCILDDDVILDRMFFEKTLREFNSDSKIMGVGAIEVRKDFRKINQQSWKFKTKNLLFRIFLLSHKEKNKFRILGPYGNTSSLNITQDIRGHNCQWLPGFVSSYRRIVFDKYRLPEQIGREVIQDIDLSYYTYLKFGEGSLVIPQDVKAIHNYSLDGRYDAIDKKRIFINHEDHFTFFYRNFHNFQGYLKLYWELSWIIFLLFSNFLIKPNNSNLLKFKYNWQAIKYCISFRKGIKFGKSRMFLTENLTMKDSF